MTTIVKFQDWTFEVDRPLTEQTYKAFSGSGAENCGCYNCKNYVAYRNEAFPKEVINLFNDLGIDYKKEAEIFSYDTLPNGLHHMSGWFHFKGRILKGKNYRDSLPSGGQTFELTQLTDKFLIGFTAESDLTFFEDDTGLVQLQFEIYIPWGIDKSFESS